MNLRLATVWMVLVVGCGADDERAIDLVQADGAGGLGWIDDTSTTPEIEDEHDVVADTSTSTTPDVVEDTSTMHEVVEDVVEDTGTTVEHEHEVVEDDTSTTVEHEHEVVEDTSTTPDIEDEHEVVEHEDTSTTVEHEHEVVEDTSATPEVVDPCDLVECCDDDDCDFLDEAGTCNDALACSGSRVVGVCGAASTCETTTIEAPEACAGVSCGASTCENLELTELVKEGLERRLCSASGECVAETIDCRVAGAVSYCTDDSDVYIACAGCSPKRDTCIVFANPCYCHD